MTDGYIEKCVNLTDDELEKINRFTRTPFEADKIYAFNVTLCNNDIDRDYEKFSVGALEELAVLFNGKTGIKDHSMKASDQTARIYETFVEKVNGKKTADGEDFYRLRAKAYMVRNGENDALITEIEAGIKKEVSVSCSMKKSTCSICGADRRSGRCEHIPGKVYGSKTAYTILSDADDAYEFSFVAVPAQREAGVTKNYDLKKDTTDMNEIINTLKSCGTTVTLTKEQAQSTADYIESLEDEARLGRDYKKNLMDEVVRLCAVAMPQMDIKTFSNVAGVMTAQELLSFKKAFTKAENSTAAPQIKSDGNAKNIYDQFKI